MREVLNKEYFNKSLRISTSVFICVFILRLVFNANPFYAAIASVSCLQGNITDSFKVGKERIIGTILGGSFGILTIYFDIENLNIFKNSFIIGLFMIIIILSCYFILRKPGSNTIACIVFLGITTNMEGRNPYFWASKRIITTILGVIIAFSVNYTLQKYLKKEK